MKKIKRPWLYPLRAIALFFFFLLIRTLTAKRIVALGYDSPSGLGLPEFVPPLISLIANLFIINSIFTLTATFDRGGYERFEAREDEWRGFLGEMADVFRSFEFIAETSVVALLTAIAVSLGGFYEAVYCISPYALPKFHALIAYGIMLGVIIITSLFSRYEARRYWVKLIKDKTPEILSAKWRVFLRIGLIAFLYPFVFPYAPFVVFMFVTVIAVFGTVVRALTIIGFILALAATVALCLFFASFGHNKRRKKFIAALTEIAKGEGRSLRINTKEEALTLGYDLTFTDGESTYDIKILRVKRRTIPLFFTSSTKAHFLYRYGTKKHHISFEKHFDYSFNSEGTKVILLIKFPKNAFVASDGGRRKIIGGDKIWEYVIYDTKTFLGSADRSCLDRFYNNRE